MESFSGRFLWEFSWKIDVEIYAKCGSSVLIMQQNDLDLEIKLENFKFPS